MNLRRLKHAEPTGAHATSERSPDRRGAISRSGPIILDAETEKGDSCSISSSDIAGG